jgi:hypothetical protein
MASIINGSSPTVTFSDGTTQATSAIVSGYVPYANLPAGSVLQVVQGTYSTNTFNSTGTLTDTNLTATITPKFSTSKILVLVNQAGVVASNSLSGVTLTLFRNSTSILGFGLYIGYASADNITNASTAYLDSPATTSATTYKTQFCRTTGSGNTIVQANGASSTIILMEVAA